MLYERESEIFHSLASGALETQSESSFHSLEQLPSIEMKSIDAPQIRIIEQKPTKTRLIIRSGKREYIITRKKQIPLNLTNLLIGYMRYKRIRTFLICNIIYDLIVRIDILAFLISEIVLFPRYSIYFLIFVSIPRLLHSLTNLKLVFMDQFRLANRSLLKISHLYRANFIEEQEPNEEELKPILYEDQILSIWSFLFILLPIELSFIPLPKDNDHIHNTIDTLLLSCYILKSIEVLIFEPILLIIISLKLNNDDVEILWRQTIYVLIIIDIVKYAILNIYLFVYGAFAVQIKNKVQV